MNSINKQHFSYLNQARGYCIVDGNQEVLNVLSYGENNLDNLNFELKITILEENQGWFARHTDIRHVPRIHSIS